MVFLAPPELFLEEYFSFGTSACFNVCVLGLVSGELVCSATSTTDRER